MSCGETRTVRMKTGPILVLVLSLSNVVPLQAQTFLGNYTAHEVSGRSVTLHADTASVRFVFYRPEIVRVDFLPGPSSVLDSSYVVIRDTSEPVSISVTETDSTLQIFSSEISILCRKTPVRFTYKDASGRTLLAEPPAGGLAINASERWLRFAVNSDEHFYGTGERGGGLDKRGQAFDSYNTQVFGYGWPLSTMNINIPFLSSTNGYGLYIDNTYRGRFEIASPNPGLLTYTAYGGELSFYIISGSTIQQQLLLYTWLTGRQPLPPRWALGYLQSKFGYRNETEVRAMTQIMRQEQIPCDAVIIDIYWFNQMGDISWNSSAFPNPQQMMSDLLTDGFKTIVITEPYIVQYSLNFPEAVSGNHLAVNTLGQPFLLHNWWACGCDAGLIDLTNPATQSWWWNKHPSFFGSQLSGVWTDLGEPENDSAGMILYGGPIAKAHNVYNLLWAKTIFEGFNQFRPNKRLFNLTRSGFAGIQRYGVVTWSGDVAKSFGGLQVQLPILLSMGLSGLAYHNSDIGGFCCGTTTPELYIRWMQYGTFCPITRAHGWDGFGPTEPWGFGTQAEDIAREYISLRYRLLPYIYSMASKNYSTGLPIARPLFIDYPTDPLLVSVSSSYLWGDDFLVSPVVEQGQTQKTVYLPQDTWVDYWTDNSYAGGQNVVVQTPLETMPLFVRAGSIVPMQSVMNYTNERPLDTLFLEVYPSMSRTASFSLYEDDGATLAYQSGSFAVSQFEQSMFDSSGTTFLRLAIGPSVGSYAGKPGLRTYVSDVHQMALMPNLVSRNGQSVPQRISLEDLRQNGNGFFYDSIGERLHIQTVTSPDSQYELIAENVLLTSIRPQTESQPGVFRLEQNFPNPFNPLTVIRYTLSATSLVRLEVFDVLGRKIAALENQVRPPGSYSVSWNGESFPTGIYFYRLTTGNFVQTRKMLLLK